MQPGVGLPRVLSLVMKRCFPRRFRDSAAQALELPQHNSGAAQSFLTSTLTFYHFLLPPFLPSLAIH